MADAYHHAVSSAKQFGGIPNDYVALHRWFDQTKSAWCDQRHRAVLHNAFGIELCIQVFGQAIHRVSDGRLVPVRWIGEQHVTEDCGFVPSLQDWFSALPMTEWMRKGARTFTRTFNLKHDE